MLGVYGGSLGVWEGSGGLWGAKGGVIWECLWSIGGIGGDIGAKGGFGAAQGLWRWMGEFGGVFGGGKEVIRVCGGGWGGI